MEVLNGFETNNNGKWIRINCNHSNPGYEEEKKQFENLINNSSWNTNENVTDELKFGSEYYVFNDTENKPHILMIAKEGKMKSIFGIKEPSDERFEPYIEDDYIDIAVSFLESNKDTIDCDDLLETEKWHSRLIEYCRKIDSGDFTKEDVPSIIKDYILRGSRPLYDVYHNLGNRLISVKSQIAEYYGCKEDEIYIGDLDFSDRDDLSEKEQEKLKQEELNLINGKYKIVFGDIIFSGSEIKRIINLESIVGTADFSDSIVEDTGDLTCIEARGIFEDSPIKDLKNLVYIGSADFEDSNVKKIEKLLYRSKNMF